MFRWLKNPLLLLLLVFMISQVSAEDDDEVEVYVFDSDNDPFEQINLLDDESVADIVEELEERFAYFQQVNVTIEPQVLEGSKGGWVSAGGVVPLDDYFDKDIIEVGEPVDGAPNIVFILLDDVGLNDMNLNRESVNYSKYNR